MKEDNLLSQPEKGVAGRALNIGGYGRAPSCVQE